MTTLSKEAPYRLLRRNRLIEENLRLVWYIGRKFRADEDMLQVGFMALIRAAELFDDSMQTRFSTYACASIVRRMLNYKKRSAPIGYRNGREAPPNTMQLTDVAEDKQDHSEMMECVALLSSEHRHLIEQYFFQGKKMREVQEAVGKSKQSGYNMLETALTNLRELMEGNPRPRKKSKRS